MRSNFSFSQGRFLSEHALPPLPVGGFWELQHFLILFYLIYFLFLFLFLVTTTVCISNSTNTIGKGMNPTVAERILNYCLAQEYFDCFGPELLCHSPRVTSMGNYKKARSHSFTLFHAGLSSWTDLSCLPLLASPLASSRTRQPTWQSIYSSFRLLAAGRTSQHDRTHSLFFIDSSSLNLSHIFRAVH